MNEHNKDDIIKHVVKFVLFLSVLFILKIFVEFFVDYRKPSANKKREIIKIAIIDSGIKNNTNLPLCDHGHEDFTGTGLYDNSGHGTNVAELIYRNSKNVPYCMIILKYYNLGERKINTTITSNLAFKKAIDLNVDMIQYSSNGKIYNLEEHAIIKKALNLGIVIVTVSGNEPKNLDYNCNVYPACLDERVVVVGRYDSDESGVGKVVDFYESGFGFAGGVEMWGTSQAAAKIGGQLLNIIYLNKLKLK